MKLPLLLSYATDKSGKLTNRIHQACQELGVGLDLFIDSGAFTAKSSGSPIKIDDYVAFLEKIKHISTWYANLDEIGDATETAVNQEYLEQRGLSPVPVFHLGSNMDIFKDMIRRYPGKIALGGLVAKPKWLVSIFLQNCAQVINDTPDRKENHYHLFGVSPTSLETPYDYAWGSFDSSAGLGFRWNRVTSPYGGMIKVSDLKGYRAKTIFFKSLIQLLYFSPRSISILEEAKKPTRGPRAGVFWNTIGLLCEINRQQKLLDSIPSIGTYYSVMMDLPSPCLELLISGANDIYENRNTSS